MQTLKTKIICATIAVAVGAVAYAAPPPPSAPIMPSAPPAPIGQPPASTPSVSPLATPAGGPQVHPIQAPDDNAGQAESGSDSAEDKAYLHDRDQLVREINLTKLRVDLKNLNDKLEGTGPSQSASPAPKSSASVISEPPRSMAPMSTIAIPAPAPMPVQPVRTMTLNSVVTVGARHAAAIRDNGQVYTAGIGTRLPSGWTVASIGDTSVTLRKGHAVRHLSVGD